MTHLAPIGRATRFRLAALALLVGCAGSGAERPGSATVDTLPGGVVRVGNAGPTWTSSERWEIVPDLVIPDSSAGPDGLDDPTTLAVDRSGRVYITDGVVKVFAPDGHFLRVIGRVGEGPGEYRTALIATAGNRLIVQDPVLARLSVFDSSGRYLRSWSTVCCAPSPPAADAAGRILVWAPDPSDTLQAHRYLRFRIDGSAIDTLVLPPDREHRRWRLKTGFGDWSTRIPFTPRRQVAAHPGGGLVHVWPAEYWLIRTRNGRDTVLLFGRAWTPAQVPESRRAAATDAIIAFVTQNRGNLGGVDSAEMAQQIHRDDVPTTAPAVLGLAVDWSGHTWAEVDPGLDTLHSHYEVFESTGTYLGPLTAPAHFRGRGATVWADSSIYSLQETAEGEPIGRRYRIRRTRP
jgi:hypothetical protein